MTTAKRIFTADELLAMPDDGNRYELVRGELVTVAPAGHNHGRVAMRLSRRIGNFVEEHDLGHDIGAETGVNIERDPDTTLAPDYGFISYERMAEPPPVSGYVQVVPDLVVEVASPNDRPADIDRKTSMWLACGVRLALVVFPEAEEVRAHHGDGRVVRYRLGDTVQGDPVLPGFTCPVADIFAFGPRDS